MRYALLAAALPLAACIGLAGCSYGSPQEQEARACSLVGPKAMLGALGGAAGGAALGGVAGGGRGAAIGAGAGLLIGAIGGHVADQQDCDAAQRALTANLANARNGSLISWNSPSGHHGQYKVTSEPFAAHDSTDCRTATSVPAPGSNAPSQPVVACRMPNGDYSFHAS